MTDIDNKIEYWKNTAPVNIKMEWDGRLVNPYIAAYTQAFKRFRETIEAQAKANQLKTELAIMAMALCGGSILNTVCAGVALKLLAQNALLNFICKHDMNKFFSVMHFAQSNRTAEFIVGNLWQNSTKMLSQKIKSKLIKDAVNFSTVKSLSPEPHMVQYVLQNFTYQSATLLKETCASLIKDDSKKLDASGKEAAFSMLKNSPFCNHPKSHIIPKPKEYARTIELTFYLSMVINSDWLSEGYTHPGGVTQVSNKPIDMDPNHPNYPSSGFITDRWRRPSPRRPTSQYFQVVHHDYIGQVFINRMNELCKEVDKQNHPIIDSKRFGERSSKEAIVKAGQILKNISIKNTRLINTHLPSEFR